jgi:hypothetical protein
MWYLELPFDAVHWQMTGLRCDHWKLVFMEQRVQGVGGCVRGLIH